MDDNLEGVRDTLEAISEGDVNLSKLETALSEAEYQPDCFEEVLQAIIGGFRVKMERLEVVLSIPVFDEDIKRFFGRSYESYLKIVKNLQAQKDALYMINGIEGILIPGVAARNTNERRLEIF